MPKAAFKVRFEIRNTACLEYRLEKIQWWRVPFEEKKIPRNSVLQILNDM